MLLLHKDFNSANVTNNSGDTALMYAAQSGHNSIVKLLLDQPAVDVNVKDNGGDTALDCAAQTVLLNRTAKTLKSGSV